MRAWVLSALLVPLSAAPAALQAPSPLNAQILAAAAKGDIPAVEGLLARGADVNADNGHGVTPLWYAADKANVELVKLLLEHGANPDAKDLEYGKPPLRVVAVSWGNQKLEKERAAVVQLLLDKGAGSTGESLEDLIRGGYYDAVKTIVGRGRVDPGYLNSALAAAKRAKQPELARFLAEAGAKDPGPTDSARSPARIKAIAGVYRSQSGGEITLRPNEEEAILERPGKEPVALLPTDLTTLRAYDLTVVITLKPGSLPPSELTLVEGGKSEVFTRSSGE